MSSGYKQLPMDATAPPQASYGPPPSAPPYAPDPYATPYATDAYTPPPAYTVQNPYAPPTYMEQQPPNPPPPTHVETADRFSSNPYWRDLAFYILFLLHLAGVFAIFGIGYNRRIHHSDTTSSYSLAASSELLPFPENLRYMDTATLFQFLYFSAAAGGSAVVFSFLWLVIVRKAAKALVIATLFAGVLIGVGIGLYYILYQRNYYAGIIWLFIALINAFFYFSWRKRIPFAVSILKHAAWISGRYPATYAFGFLAMIIQFGWAIFWAYTLLLTTEFSNNTLYGLMVYLVFSFYWTTQVIQNLVHVTAAGSFATWYFMGAEIHNPTTKSFRRAATWSFGSIALGSLLVAFVKMLKLAVTSIQQRSNNCLTCIAACLVSCFDSLLRYFNLYAFTYVAVYGKTYCEAAKATFDLVRRTGFLAFVNDSLLSGVLFLGAFLGGLASCFTSGYLGYLFMRDQWIVLAALGFFIGFTVVSMSMEVVQSGISSTFVCFVDNPEALRAHNPELHQQFYATYHQQPAVDV